MKLETRIAYLAFAVLLAVSGTAWMAARTGPVAATAVGVGAAWVVQAIAICSLPARVPRDHAVMERWLSGPLLRVAGIAALAACAPLLGVGRRVALVAYCGAMVAFLLLEAAWLWWTTVRAA